MKLTVILLGLILLLATLQDVCCQFGAILQVNQEIDSEELSHGESGILQHDDDPPIIEGYSGIAGAKIDYKPITKEKCFKSITLLQCQQVGAQEGLSVEEIDSETRPHGCYFMRAQNKFFFNEKQTEAECTAERECYCATDYLTFTSAKCFQHMSLVQCQEVGKKEKLSVEEIDSEARPHGCYFMRAQNKFFFNEKFTDENCTEERKCYCSRVKLLEGDIVDTPEIENVVAGGTHEGNTKRDATTGGKWTDGIIRYMFERGHERLESAVKSAIAEYTRQLGGCLKFYKYKSRASLAAKNRKNYIVFFIGQGCYSSIGMTRGEQKISLGEGCTGRGTVMHEMMHALGFWHEQSRLDRNKYIYVDTNNVQSNMMHNFQQYKSNQASTLGAPYDLYSVMHYPPSAFSRNGRATIIAVGKYKGRTDFGWRDNLSPIDIQQLKAYYSCSRTKTTTTEKVAVTRVDGGWTTWKWGSCSKSCGGGTRRATRSCTNPSPRNGGRVCSGKSTYYASCNTSACPRVSSSCVNKNSNCVYWAQRGNCRSRSYGPYMNKNCRKACGFCR